MANTGVLVTGTSTGIGHEIALVLAQRGLKVFACVRNIKDQEKLKVQSQNITPIVLDVTNPQHIQAAFDTISSCSFDVFHLINNAGIVVVGPAETLSVSEFRRQFDVNIFGLISVTQIFLPLIRKTKGRIVNIGSINGLSSSPFLAAYSASKFALEAFSDSLRWELANSQVKVILIEPGPIATPIWGKGMADEEKIKNAIPLELRSYYARSLDRFSKAVRAESKNAISSQKVCDAVVRSLSSKSPPPRIIVASLSSRIQAFAFRILPQKWIDWIIQKSIFR